MGVKCRLCDEVIINEMEARQLFEVGAHTGPQGFDPFRGMALLATPILVNGALHMLMCKRTKLN